jgi:hypothetical protein
MNAKSDNKPDLEAVLDEFASLSGPPDAATLNAFIADHPQFERELIEFATDWVATDAARHRQPVTAALVDSIVNRTMSRVQSMMDEADRSPEIVDLAADIKAAGHDLESFQRAVGIDRTILDGLIDRLVIPATLPARLVTMAAAALKRSADQFREYVLIPPRLAAANKSRGRPSATQAEFQIFVRDSGLPEEDRTRWLAEPPDPKLAA